MDKPVITLSMKKSHSAAILSRNNMRKTEQSNSNSKGIQENQQKAINIIIRELSKTNNNSETVQSILIKPHIQKMFKDDFKMNLNEIKDFQQQIINQCKEIINKQSGDSASSVANHSHRKINTSRNQSCEQSLTAKDQSKQQPLTMLQRKELERQQTLDYLNFPAQPCLKSLYYLSKIAQTQSLRIIVPPTVLIGFGDDNRIIYNDYKTGNLVVESKNISPKRIQNFIQSHMINGPEQQTYSTEDKLIYPRFVIKIATKGSTNNEIKLYYSRESLIADLLSFWGSYDIALQAFVKQKHPMRPCIYRCFINKNGNVYKAIAINNQENINKDSRFYKTFIQIIEDVNQKQKKTFHQRNESQSKQQTSQDQVIGKSMPSNLKSRLSILESSNSKTIIVRRGTIMNQKLSLKDILTQPLPKEKLDPHCLDEKGFPKNFDLFKVNDYYNLLSQSMPNSDLKRAFIVTSEFIDNLTMMNCRPSALPQAQLMTMDLFRLFSQYYLKIQKFGNISQFVCDFIEGHNGLMYLLQVKSFECEGILYDWQVPFTQTGKQGKLLTQQEIKIAEEASYMKELEDICEARIICQDNKMCPLLKEWFIKECKNNEIWEFTGRREKQPTMAENVIKKYFLEIESGKETCFCLQSEKVRISPLFPLITFCDQQKQQAMIEKIQSPVHLKMFKPRHSIIGQQYNKQIEKQNQEGKTDIVNDDFIQLRRPQTSQGMNNQYTQIQSERQQVVCLACLKVLELYSSRYYALVFKTEQTMDELRKLKLKLVNHWTLENVQFLLKIYKDSKKSLYIVSEIDKIEKRVQEQAVRERAKSPDSVMRKSIKNKRPDSSYRADATLLSSRGQSIRFDRLLSIDCESSPSKRRPSSRSKLMSSQSLMRSVEKFKLNVENIGGVPYEMGKIEEVLQTKVIVRPSANTKSSTLLQRPLSSNPYTVLKKDQATGGNFAKMIEDPKTSYQSLLKLQMKDDFQECTQQDEPYRDPELKKTSSQQTRFKNKEFQHIYGDGKKRNFIQNLAAVSTSGGQQINNNSSGHSTSSINLGLTSARGTSASGVINSATQKSDYQMSEYFNNKRILSRQQYPEIYLRSSTNNSIQKKKKNKDRYEDQGPGEEIDGSPLKQVNI